MHSRKRPAFPRRGARPSAARGQQPTAREGAARNFRLGGRRGEGEMLVVALESKGGDRFGGDPRDGRAVGRDGGQAGILLPPEAGLGHVQASKERAAATAAATDSLLFFYTGKHTYENTV